MAQRPSVWILVAIQVTIRIQEFLKNIYSTLYYVGFIRQVAALNGGGLCSLSASSYYYFIKPPPPVGASGGYMFSGRPSVPLSMHPCVRP